MRKQIKAWIEANATDNVKVLEIEAVAEKFALEFLSFVQVNYTKTFDTYDLKERPYWDYKGKNVSDVLKAFKENKEKLEKWVKNGAKPTETVKNLIDRTK